MSSPAPITISSFVQLDKSIKTPLFIQLTQQIINGIQRGFLLTGTKLPGTRQVSKELNVHRKTIIAAFDELQAQGWIEILPNRGTYVLQQNKTKLHALPNVTPISIAQYPLQTGYNLYTSNILDNPFEENESSYFFTDGTCDMRLAQTKRLSLQYSATMNRKSSLKQISHYRANGNSFFKDQLSNYLNLTRGLHISKNNLLITRGSEMAIYLIAKVLLKPLDVVVVAELSNFTVNMTFQETGAKVITVPLDSEGICVESLKELLNETIIRLLYITPHHHYPTTVQLSAQRRIEILELANKYGFTIVEDDYDYDFHYEKAAVLPLASADINGMVIYTGTFAQTLTPAFRTGFIVAPQNLIQEMKKHLSLIDRYGDPIMEQVLGELIDDGEIHRNLKKTNKIYQDRRDAMAEKLNTLFTNDISFDVPSGGLAFWVKIQKPISLMSVQLAAKKKDLYIPRHTLFQNKTVSALRIGFGHMNADEMVSSIDILHLALHSV